MTRLFGPLVAVALVLLGALAVGRARTPGSAIEAVRALGTLLTVVTGLFSALWWHQSASLADSVPTSEITGPERQRSANLLNAAAATATGLALLGGVFSNLSWRTPEGALAGSAFLLLLAMSGNEIRGAAMLSFRQGLRPRSALAFLILLLASLLFVVRWLL